MPAASQIRPAAGFELLSYDHRYFFIQIDQMILVCSQLARHTQGTVILVRVIFSSEVCPYAYAERYRKAPLVLHV